MGVCSQKISGIEEKKNRRKEKGMSQEKLAIRLHVVRQTVSKWEKGLSVPDADLLKKLAEVLETDVSVLLGETIVCNSDRNEIAEQLSRMNDLLAARARRTRIVFKTLGYVALAVLLFHFVWLLFGLTVDKKETTTEEQVCVEQAL